MKNFLFVLILISDFDKYEDFVFLRKPTIKYRVEGFIFFICNAWELMLKAHMINKFGDNSIYYKDNPKRTITLESCIQKIFTNEKSPLHCNLLKIIELRNTSTHFITEEYEMIYIPLFLACVLNFVRLRLSIIIILRRKKIKRLLLFMWTRLQRLVSKLSRN